LLNFVKNLLFKEQMEDINHKHVLVERELAFARTQTEMLKLKIAKATEKVEEYSNKTNYVTVQTFDSKDEGYVNYITSVKNSEYHKFFITGLKQEIIHRMMCEHKLDAAYYPTLLKGITAVESAMSEISKDSKG